MNYDELKPGRELDALVAERVMGWKLLPDTAYGHSEQAAMDANKMAWFDNNNDYIAGELDYDHQFSTDIAAAWQVVEKLREDDWWWSASYRTTTVEEIKESRPGYWVTFRCVRGGVRGDRHGNSSQLSHAICIAALKAVEVT